ncbi:MAG TPA: hypothetical protein VKZ82_28405 [Nonomuraea sp.]|nr:hypothetical protein [Nonomuraea sp.]
MEYRVLWADEDELGGRLTAEAAAGWRVVSVDWRAMRDDGAAVEVGVRVLLGRPT